MAELKLTIVDQQTLDEILREVRALRHRIDTLRVEPEPEWVTVEEYARRAGRTESTVRRWISDGRLKTKRAGKRVLVRV